MKDEQLKTSTEAASTQVPAQMPDLRATAPGEIVIAVDESAPTPKPVEKATITTDTAKRLRDRLLSL